VKDLADCSLLEMQIGNTLHNSFLVAESYKERRWGDLIAALLVMEEETKSCFAWSVCQLVASPTFRGRWNNILIGNQEQFAANLRN
jgi:hypothetical protein